MGMYLARIRYFVSKIRRAWSDGTLGSKARRFLRASARIPAESVLAWARLPKADRRISLRAGLSDHRIDTRHHRSDRCHLERIVAAYRASKQAEPQAAAPFQIRGLWSEWIDVNFRELKQALLREDFAELSKLFENFHREQFAIGAGGGYDDYVRFRTTLTGGCYLKSVWCGYRDALLSLGFDLADLDSPWVGNPVGVLVNGRIIPTQTLRHAYHAWEMRDWLRDVPQAVVVEIGGGVGGQAYQAMRLAGSGMDKYLVFDIPEVAAVSAYFLLSALPDKRIRLFGEGPVSAEPYEDYDLAVFPHFAITHLADRSVDLFHNACSFSEMDATASQEYLRIIERTCRRYFSHINHDVPLEFRNPDGTASRNQIGSQLVPAPDSFRRLFKKPRVLQLPEDKAFPAYEYLYERTETAATHDWNGCEVGLQQVTGPHWA